MNNQQLENFRSIADQMFPDQSWQWIGKWESQRMFGISQERAEAYAKQHGGEAKQMVAS